jgi:hypothetical protein
MIRIWHHPLLGMDPYDWIIDSFAEMKNAAAVDGA